MVLLFCHHYHLLSPLYGSCLLLPLSVESSISTDTEIDGAAANGGWLPTHSGHGTLVRLYPQDDTLLSVWLIWCHITYIPKCICARLGSKVVPVQMSTAGSLLIMPLKTE